MSDKQKKKKIRTLFSYFSSSDVNKQVSKLIFNRSEFVTIITVAICYSSLLK